MIEQFGRTITLYSPILPMITGTADYFEHVIETFRKRAVPLGHVRIIVDNDLLPPTKRRTHVLGYPVQDYRTIPNVVAENETRVYFVANNEYHSYIHYSIARAHKLKGGRIISIIHDPSCAMLLKNLSYNGFFGFSPALYAEVNRAQFGRSTQKIIDDRNSGNLSEIVEYVSHSQGATLDASDEIWTHSRFATLKLILESDLPTERMPHFRYCIHPRYHTGSSSVASAAKLSEADRKKPGTFRFGIFGWAAPSKRIYEALNAFRLMLARIPREDRELVEFIVVGKLPSAEYYDPSSHARAIGVSDRCRFFGFVEAGTFRALVDDCDCVLNLRYPSCGESSGVSAHAHGSGTKLFMSACQAFNEEDADEHIEPLAPLEEFALASAMSRIFLSRNNSDAASRRSAKNEHLASMDELLAAEAWSDIASGQAIGCAGGARLSSPKDIGNRSSLVVKNSSFKSDELGHI